MDYLSYFLILGSGTSCVSTTNVEFGQRGPTLVGYVDGPGSCEDLVKILARSLYPCYIVVVCICYDLICSLLTMHECATCTLTELVMHKLWIAESPKNGACMHVCLLHISIY